MIIALNPKTTITFSTKGTAITLPLPALTCFCISSHRKKTKNRKAMLQMKVKRDKKIIIRINQLS